jgi:hypothetical protein
MTKKLALTSSPPSHRENKTTLRRASSLTTLIAVPNFKVPFCHRLTIHLAIQDTTFFWLNATLFILAQSLIKDDAHLTNAASRFASVSSMRVR